MRLEKLAANEAAAFEERSWRIYAG